jgi:hypothetical protein
MIKRTGLFIVVAAVLAIIPIPAHADIGLPLIAVFLPPMWLALIPVVVVEAAVNGHLLAMPFRRSIVPASMGNLVSTIAGIPLMWLLLATAELVCCGEAKGLSTSGAKIYAVTIQAPWLIPYERDFHWMIPLALLVFAVPCYALSVAIEAPFNVMAFKTTPKKLVWRATAAANLASYLCLALLFWVEMRFFRNVNIGIAFFEPIINWFLECVFRVAGSFAAK